MQLPKLNRNRWFCLADDVWFSFYFGSGKTKRDSILNSGPYYNSHLLQQYTKSIYTRINYIQYTDTISDIYGIIKMRKLGAFKCYMRQKVDILLSARTLTTFLALIVSAAT